VKGDFSRLTFERTKSYSGVRQQQGRIQLDSDWNEQFDIERFFRNTSGKYIIGDSGAPHNGNGFKLSSIGPVTDLHISAGKFYVDGILCDISEGREINVELNKNSSNISLATLSIDGINLHLGDWLEITTADGRITVSQIVNINKENNIITIAPNASASGKAILKRIRAYSTQEGCRNLSYSMGKFAAIASFPENNKVVLSTLTVDSIEFATGEWVEIWAEDRQISIIQIESINKTKKQVTFNVDISDYTGSTNPKLAHLSPRHSGFPPLPRPGDTPGIYLAYLDVWDHHVTSVTEPGLLEVALGGPDSTTRLKTISQVKVAKVAEFDDEVNPLSSFSAWDEITSGNKGKMNARTMPGSDLENLCIIPPSGGYRLLENQLYRVEIHKGGILDADWETEEKVTFKWSRNNGTMVRALKSIAGNNITVDETGGNILSRFKVNDLIEITDEERTLRGESGTLAILSEVEGNYLTIAEWPGGIPLSMDDFNSSPTVRRWDCHGEMPVNIPAENGGWIRIEGGIEIRFEHGSYSPGDYWLIPARINLEDIIWPREGAEKIPVPQNPHGIRHHFARLALMKFDGIKWAEIHDCRKLFAPLSDYNLVYVCGDGQEAKPGDPLPQPLTVKVLNCHHPVVGAHLKFNIVYGDGIINPVEGIDAKDPLEEKSGGYKSFTVTTDSSGEARCVWQLPPKTKMRKDAKGTLHVQQVEAILMDPDGRELSTPVLFGASFSIAEKVSYDSNPQSGTVVDTVEEALDELMQNHTLRYVSGDGQTFVPFLYGDDGSIETKPDTLPHPLEVRVANGNWPTDKAKVVFEIINDDGSGALSSSAGNGRKIMVETDASGFASCEWKIDKVSPAQRAISYLEDKPDMVIGFNSFLNQADEIAYKGSDFPDSQHPDLIAESIETAIDQLRENYSLHYVSGDGQSTMPDIVDGENNIIVARSILSQSLEVRVANGQWTVKDADVNFRVLTGNGTLSSGTTHGPIITVKTDANGLAHCDWRLGNSDPVQRIEAFLPDKPELLIGFNAFLNTAEDISYDGSAFPDEQHPDLIVNNVKDALDQLRQNFTLHYVGGDGQNAKADNTLPAPLQVRVANGSWPVKDAEVTFAIIAGSGAVSTSPFTPYAAGAVGSGAVSGTASGAISSGTATPPASGAISSGSVTLPASGALYIEPIKTLTVKTDINGMAECYWILDPNNATQQIRATLGNRPETTLIFNASLNSAKDIFYDGEGSVNLQNAHTIQDAISKLDEITSAKQPAIHITNVLLTRTDGNQISLVNDMDVNVHTFINGIHVELSDEIAVESVNGKPVCEVRMEIPVNLGSTGKLEPGQVTQYLQPDCYSPIILATDANATGKFISIQFRDTTIDMLLHTLFTQISDIKRMNRILTHLKIKGNFIWGKNNPEMLLDGEFLTMPGGASPLLSGNSIQGGDYEIWFYINNPIPPITSAIPAGGLYSGIDVALNVNDRSNTGISATYFTTDGSTPTIDSATYSSPVRLDTEGTTTLSFFSTDEAGNIEPVKTETYTIDLTAPNSPIVSTADTSPTNNKTPEWRWASGGNGGNGTYRYKLGNADLTTGATETKSRSYVPEFELVDGGYTLYVQERDEAGNWSSSGSCSIVIDTVPPAINSTYPKDGTTGVPIV